MGETELQQLVMLQGTSRCMPDMQNDKLIFESGIKDQIGIASQRRKMALRVEKAFGPKMEHLMRMQLNYDLALARAAADRIWVNVV